MKVTFYFFAFLPFFLFVRRPYKCDDATDIARTYT